MRRTQVPAVLLLLLSCGGVLAYTFTGSRWIDGSTVIHVGIGGRSPSGVTWSSVLRDVMDEWSSNTEFEFIADEGYLDPCAGLRRNDENGGAGFPLGAGDGRSGTDFRTTVCGNSWGTGVLALTMQFSKAGPPLGFSVFDQTDVIFNANYQWDLYSGPSKSSPIDFRRVALHELGHALGLDHSTAAATIMNANIGAVHTLQEDDISGANALYGGGTCPVHNLAANATINDRLTTGDCRVRDLFGSSNDTSFVDVYRLTLTEDSDVDVVLHSTEFDPVLILANANLGGIELHDDTEGGCDARIRKHLPAGEYRLLVNTYETPEKCGSNVGAYNLTISDTGMPLLGAAKNVSGGPRVANAVFTGGATADSGTSFPGSFGANEAINVSGNIVPDPSHVGREGSLYVLAVLGDGRRFMQNGSGNFVPFSGDLDKLAPRRTGPLGSQEFLAISSGLRGTTSGLAGQNIAVYIGYALDSEPAAIWYGSTPIRFTIRPQ
jgi:hypothetical protein